MIRLALRVARADAELVLADLLELAPGGVEEVELPACDGAQARVEYAVYGPPGELPRLPDLQALAGGVPVELSTSELPDDWDERWKQFHRPVLIEAQAAGVVGGSAVVGADGSVAGVGGALAGGDGRRSAARVPSLYVRPPWEPRCEREDALEIVIDPAQAFGTGAHATTHLCLELLLAVAAADPERGAAIDVGAGSGVLAIAAAKLGYGPVLALDNDPLSIEAIEANAAIAGVALAVNRHDLRSQPLSLSAPAPEPGGAAPELGGAAPGPGGASGFERGPLVLANLLRPLLLDLLARIERAPRHLIASGLLREEAGEVAAAYARRLGMREHERRQRGEWAALWLTAE